MRRYIFIVLSLCIFSSSAFPNATTGSRQLFQTQASFPEWVKNAVIYEVNIRQYTKDGTFKAFIEHLPRLKAMGVDILWFMPIHPISEKNRKGSLGSYYAVRNYRAVNPEFGSLEDFKAVVSTAHRLGMKVIMDWVANHTGPDHQWVENYPDWYIRDSQGNLTYPHDWSDIAELDYANKSMRKEMIHDMAFWIKETNIDGFRCDFAGHVPVDFWENAAAILNKMKPLFWLAEDERNSRLLERVFIANYSWSMYFLMNEIARGNRHAQSLVSYFQTVQKYYPKGSFPMHFTSNHDENSWRGTEFERLGEATETFAALTFVVPGIPLIYSGQEAAFDRRLAFFDKDEIEWKGFKRHEFYGRLAELAEKNEALWHGDAGGWIMPIESSNPKEIFAFVRKKNGNKVLSMFNLSDRRVGVSFSDEKMAGKYQDFLEGQRVKIPMNYRVEIPAWGYKIYVSEQ